MAPNRSRAFDTSTPSSGVSAFFKAEPPVSRCESFRYAGSAKRVGRGGSRRGGKRTPLLSLRDLPPDTLFPGVSIPTTSGTVAHVAGITGRSSPAPEWWGHRPRRSFGTGEERPSSPATTDGESHIKAPPSTSEPVRISEVGWGRLRPGLLRQPDERFISVHRDIKWVSPLYVIEPK